MKPSTHAPRALAALLALSALTACSNDPGGPHYTELGIILVSTTNVPLHTECVPLPVLPGGTIDEDLFLADPLVAHVFAVRDYAEVTLRGTNDPSSPDVKVSESALLAGYSQAIDVTLADGRKYIVSLASPCPSAAQGQ